MKLSNRIIILFVILNLLNFKIETIRTVRMYIWSWWITESSDKDTVQLYWSNIPLVALVVPENIYKST